MKKTHKQALTFLGSNWFVLLFVLLFAAETSWIALTSRFPMAFDETYHFGLIQFFSHHLNPFISSQPASADFLGAVPHNPSILYHYLLSFPYRLIAHFARSLETQVIALRFINIAFAITSLIIIRKTLRTIGFSKPLSNILVLLYAFTPLVSQLSAQMSYDNLLILLASLALLQTVKLRNAWQAGRFDLTRLLALLVLCLFTSEVKYTFVPIFAGIVLYLAWLFAVKLRPDRAKLVSSLKAAYGGISASLKTGLLALLIAGAGVFTYFYGYNAVKYHNPVPQCNQVLNVNACMHYGPWERNYLLAAHNQGVPRMNPAHYTYTWLHGMFYQLFSAVSPNGGRALPASTTLKDMIVLLAGLAVVCLALNFQKITKQYPYLAMFAVITAVYLLALWAVNYRGYLHLGAVVGVQGRYLLPILIFIYGAVALSLKSGLEIRQRSRLVLQLMTVLVLVVFLSEGGYKTYIAKVSPGQHWASYSALTYTRPIP